MQQTILRDLGADAPYEKCLAKGPEALSDAELLAVILRTGAKGRTAVAVGEEILARIRAANLTGLCHVSLHDLMEIKGVGKVKAIQLCCIAELSMRIASAKARSQLSFHRPDTIADYFMERLRHKEREEMICLFLDTRNGMLGEKVLTIGTVNASLISPRDVFLEALKVHAVSLILIHNHPSGDPTPSREDHAVTKRIKRAGELLDVRLLDHIVIGDCRYYSFREHGYL